MASLTRTVTPTVEPLTAAEARRQAIIEDTEQDDLLELYITGARQYVQLRTNRQLITATFELKMDGFPGIIYLPRGTIQSVASVVYYDTAGDSQTLVAGTDYQTDTASEPGRIAVEPGTTWPSTEGGRMNVVTVTFDAGYGATASDVPVDLKNVLRLLVAHQFKHREAFLVGRSLVIVPIGAVEAMLANYVVDSFGFCLSEQ